MISRSVFAVAVVIALSAAAATTQAFAADESAAWLAGMLVVPGACADPVVPSN